VSSQANIKQIKSNLHYKDTFNNISCVSYLTQHTKENIIFFCLHRVRPFFRNKKQHTTIKQTEKQIKHKQNKHKQNKQTRQTNIKRKQNIQINK
jgi:hypothetical protein